MTAAAQQLALNFTAPVVRLPRVVDEAMAAGATLAVSISGGKDGDAMLRELVALHRVKRWPGRIYAVHADLGRAEWRHPLAHTGNHVESICERLGVDLVVVRRTKGDLYARFEERTEAVEQKGAPWAPDNGNRYCTSHLKSGPIDINLREQEISPPGLRASLTVAAPWAPDAKSRYCTSDLKRTPLDGDMRGHQLVICAMGIRAQESRRRAKKPAVAIRTAITTARLKALSPGKTGTPSQHEAAAEEALRLWEGDGRLALDWHPILDFTEAEVWEACGTTIEDLELRRRAYAAGFVSDALDGWPAHAAYVMGNKRLSCVFCFMANQGDLANGARHNPSALLPLIALGDSTGKTFRAGASMRDLIPIAFPGYSRDTPLLRLWDLLGQAPPSPN